jgi:hypothetical protein
VEYDAEAFGHLSGERRTRQLLSRPNVGVDLRRDLERSVATTFVVEQPQHACFVEGFGHQVKGSCPSTPIAAYRGFEVTVRPASSGTIRLGLRCPDRSDALEYATARTIDLAQVAAYGIGLFQRIDHVLAAMDGELSVGNDSRGPAPWR